MNAKSGQEEMDELILKSLKNKELQNNNDQNSSSTWNKRKENTKSCSSEETTDNIRMISGNLKKDDETKSKKQKERSKELQGEFNKLKLPMFNEESKEAAKAWLLIFHILNKISLVFNPNSQQ